MLRHIVSIGSLLHIYHVYIHVYVGEANDFGEVGRVVSQGRTSSNAWCSHGCASVSAYTHTISYSITYYSHYTCIHMHIYTYNIYPIYTIASRCEEHRS